MIAEYNLKPLSAFVSSNFENYAICSKDFDIEETSNSELFEAFIEFREKEQLVSIEKKTDCPFSYEDGFYNVTVLPHYKTKKLIDGFIVTAENVSEELVIPFIGDSNSVYYRTLKKNERSLHNLLAANEAMRNLTQEFNSNKLELALLDSDAEITRLLIENLNLFTLLNTKMTQEDLEISTLFSAVQDEFMKKIGVVGREINASLFPEYAFMRVAPEQFVSAIANSIHYLIKTSPRRHSVDAEITADDKKCVFRLSAKRASNADEYDSKCALFHLLLKKAISTDCNGTAEIEVKRSQTIITITLPRNLRPLKENIECDIFEKISAENGLVKTLTNSILDDEQ